MTTARIHSGTRRPFGAGGKAASNKSPSPSAPIRPTPSCGFAPALRPTSRSSATKCSPKPRAMTRISESLEPIGCDRSRRTSSPFRRARRRCARCTSRHGGQLLARLPVVPGAERQVEVPLPDDDAAAWPPKSSSPRCGKTSSTSSHGETSSWPARAENRKNAISRRPESCSPRSTSFPAALNST